MIEPNLCYNISEREIDLYDRFSATNAQGAVLIGEIPELLTLISDLIRLGTALVTPARWPRSFAILRRSFGSAWLGYNFGLAPTLSDIGQLVDSLNRLRRSEVRPPVRSSLRFQGPGSMSLTNFPWDVVGVSTGALHAGNSSGTSNWYFEPVYYQRRKLFVPLDRWKEYLAIKARKPSDIPFMQLLHDWGLDVNANLPQETLSLFFLTVWELIPFSWLVDYFVNIGSLVSQVTGQARSDSAINELVQISSVRFSGYEFGIVTGATPQWTDRYGDLIYDDKFRYYVPIAHYGVREFLRSEVNQLDWPTGVPLKAGITMPSIGQFSNIVALLLAKL